MNHVQISPCAPFDSKLLLENDTNGLPLPQVLVNGSPFYPLKDSTLPYQYPQIITHPYGFNTSPAMYQNKQFYSAGITPLSPQLAYPEQTYLFSCTTQPVPQLPHLTSNVGLITFPINLQYAPSS